MKKVLIVVDFQNDFVDGALGFSGAKDLEIVIVNKIKDYLSKGYDLIYTLDTHYDNYLNTQEGIKLPIKHCIKGSFGHRIYGKAANYLSKAVKVFEKNTFGSLDLGNYLASNKYDEIELVGLVTNMCVISNAIIAKAALPEAKIIIDRKASMSFNEDLHNKTFDVLEGMQFEVI